MALVSFEVEDDLEATADCRQAEALLKNRVGIGQSQEGRRELALVAGGSFQVEEDLEAAADCRQAETL